MTTWATVVSDDFNRANETPLAGSWTSPITGEQALNLNTNQVVTSTDNDSSARYSGRAWANDQSSSAVLTTVGSSGGGQGIGVCVRAASGARTYYRLIIDHAGASNAVIHRMVGGVQTVLDTWTQAFTNGDRFTLRVSGSASAAQLEVLRNGVSVRTPAADNSSLASGTPGLAYSSASVSGQWDSWEGGELQADAVYQQKFTKLPKKLMMGRPGVSMKACDLAKDAWDRRGRIFVPRLWTPEGATI